MDFEKEVNQRGVGGCYNVRILFSFGWKVTWKEVK